MFKVIITFTSGDSHTEEHSEDTLISALQRLTFGPAARMGIISKVKVVDHLDCVNFESRWTGSEMRVTFPPNLVLN